MGHSVLEIKSESIQAVMDTLAREPYITRNELAARCQLSLTTIGKIVNSLYEYGVLSVSHPKTVQKGRTPSTIGFSDAAKLALFCIEEREMGLDLIDFRLRSTNRISRRTTPDRDPAEAMTAFLTECRRTLAPMRKQIRLCGIVTERQDTTLPLPEQEISAQLELSVTFRDCAADAMARAATEQGIITGNDCGVLLTDQGGGFILYHGEICQGGLSSAFCSGQSHADHIHRITDTFLTLTSIISPNVLLVCTEYSPDRLRQNLEFALDAASLPSPMRIEVRNIHDLIVHGAGIAMRRAWLDEVMTDIRRLRPTPAVPHPFTAV